MKNSSKSFGRPRLLVVGCGDVGMRALPALVKRFRVFAVTSSNARHAALRAAGAVPVVANLDDAASLHRISRLAPRVLHLAPPAGVAGSGSLDLRTRRLRATLARPPKPVIVPEGGQRALSHLPRAPRRVLVYASTSGVYGDCGGALVDETRTPQPRSPRGQRRVDAEATIRALGRSSTHSRSVRRWLAAGPGRSRAPAATGTRAAWRHTEHARAPWRASIVRIPGIYAADRLPVARLQRGTPALRASDDVFTNHIHADDLAAILIRAMWRGKAQRVVHASDDTEWRMGEYFDHVADALGLARPPRISRDEAARVLEPTLLSFMSESRRLANTRLKRELGYRLTYPDVATLLATLPPAPPSSEAA
ncbi:NAD(P)-dependent oxidoreductase [Pandoraea apista]|uniref:SDR family NAD(P)-dependent oxidoreductase n=1 Tax=Pandoraea apista TaxID=93218 RepID=A0ABX9ZKE4_9BURK|nr:NAD(P)-dependent oxidoreductase [Pandoraea apista]AVF42051.1 NAD(P)-dependent oxidoreductase [Pandoraea apista]PTE01817.1 NAD(P)-dependent oxidoreductase [Pandoraea apista]RRJ28378.1 SDR family NAD(P)-dependent oxidoreductase [Pandoraea apista]RRJ73565.1 SDR family NAD(P)-dependent oxidoreductase [Pandoraea apista]RSD06894.1 SDR family NAD(P)-dependent oxidoreductase [Pandoraea apista]